jgi:3-phytase
MGKPSQESPAAKCLSGKRNLFIIGAACIAVLMCGILFLFIFHPAILTRNTDQSSFPGITARFETKPLPQDAKEDAADDPAIWIHHKFSDSSRIIGTDKKGGLAVYDLKGNELYYYPDGLMNNADLRYGFINGSDTIDIMAVTNRTDNTIGIYRIHRNGSIEKINKRPLVTEMEDEVYGLCMYKSLISSRYFVFINNKYGVVEQWELFSEGNQVDGRIVRKLKLETQVEGMVADDDNSVLFVGEEDKGIWKFNAEPDAPAKGILIMKSGEADNPNIKSDVEGLAIYCLPNGNGYLIASSQGNDSYAVFNRKEPYDYLGSFRIVDGTIDGTEVTDGLDVTSAPLGNTFHHGLLVVQDGINKENGKSSAQNFKLADWDSVAIKFTPSLETTK